jgi:hypothetical protein
MTSETMNILHDNSIYLQVLGFGLESGGLGWSAVAGYYGHCDEPSIP